MPVTDRFIEFVVDQLDACGPISSKRMFGGVGIYAGDLFFALLDDDVLYLKVDDSNRADFEAVGMGPFRPYGAGGEVMQYYEVPVGVLEDATELGRWAAKAIAVARAKKASKPKPRVGAKKTTTALLKKKRPRSLSSTKPAGSRKRRVSDRKK